MMKNRWLAVSALAYSVVQMTSAHAGVDNGGGGTVYYPPAKGARPVLLELQLERPGFSDTYEFTQTAVRLTHGGKSDFFDIQTEPAMALVEARLRAWQNSSPAVIEAIRATIASTRYIVTSHSLPLLERYVLRGELSNPQTVRRLKTAVFYHPAFGAIFSASVFAKLGDYSKAGLIIHEAFRQIQMAYDAPMETMEDETIQRNVARIMLSEPRAGETLDQSGLYRGYLSVLISNSPSVAQQRALEFCGMIERFNEKFPEVELIADVRADNCKGSLQFADMTVAYVWFATVFGKIDIGLGAAITFVRAPSGPHGATAGLLNLHQIADLNKSKARNAMLVRNTPTWYQLNLELPAAIRNWFEANGLKARHRR